MLLALLLLLLLQPVGGWLLLQVEGEQLVLWTHLGAAVVSTVTHLNESVTDVRAREGGGHSVERVEAMEATSPEMDADTPCF